ncbi:DUF2326 domain-containing protein [Micromonospora echinofusca]|uniref:DUF2326 domain-containing protein n=1 Tax=Micromonospora TaxID=1873 RepID=UPI003421AD27
MHDSYLFDGVDDRQLAAALGLAAEVTVREGLQYIITLNSDDLDKARRRGFDADPHLLPQRLTNRTTKERSSDSASSSITIIDIR